MLGGSKARPSRIRTPTRTGFFYFQTEQKKDKIMKLTLWKIVGLIMELADQIIKAADDGKITVTEGLAILRTACMKLGIDFDEQGIEIRLKDDAA